MSAKIDIATTAHSPEEVASILSDFTSSKLLKQKKLYGGYSGASYRVDLDDGSTFVLKMTNGYSAEHAELMCRTAHHLSEAGCKDCCLPILRIDAANNESAMYRFVSTKEQNGEPSFLLTYSEGGQADCIMREQPHLATTVMMGIGGGLARMHGSATGITGDEADKMGLRWYQKDGGCCDVQDQVDGKVLTTLLSCDDDRTRGFIGEFYLKELSALQAEMQLAKEGRLIHGITHGDPFADNVLVDSKSGELCAFIDIEDFCAGPLLFDLACCAIGCCFKKSTDQDCKYPQVLDMALLEALLNGYCRDRKLPQIEQDHFVPFMRLTLLCNCSWRFVKFNVKSGDEVPEEAKNSYLELQRRIEYLHDPEVVQSISQIIKEHS